MHLTLGLDLVKTSWKLKTGEHHPWFCCSVREIYDLVNLWGGGTLDTQDPLTSPSVLCTFYYYFFPLVTFSGLYFLCLEIQLHSFTPGWAFWNVPLFVVQQTVIWLQVLVPTSYQSVPPLSVFIVLFLASPTRRSYCTCPLGVFPTTNTRLFSLPGFLVSSQLEWLIVTVYLQLSTDKKPKPNQKMKTPQELLDVLEIFSLSETDNNFDRNAALEDNGIPKQS